MASGTKLASISLISFTLLSLLTGLALLGAGIWMLVSQDKLFNMQNMINEDASSSFKEAIEVVQLSQQRGVVSYSGPITVAAGSIGTVVSLFGFFVTIKQSLCLLYVYAELSGVLLAAQVAAGSLAIVYKGRAEHDARYQLTRMQEKYLISVNEFISGKQQPQTEVSLLFNYMFVALDCCGVDSSLDASRSDSWLQSNRTWLGHSNMTVPAACCPVHENTKDRLLAQSRWDLLPELLQSSSCPATGVGVNKKGCMTELLQFIASYSVPFLVGSVVFAFAQLVIIFLTLHLRNAIKNGEHLWT